ncbi:hypothetical protein K438DRAFT_1983055 [Mycena galopus ATCC 62051]|nr:hypothetical protein K438DRAFT_1983055 [Mycena galopus ATCC 62051]
MTTLHPPGQYYSSTHHARLTPSTQARELQRIPSAPGTPVHSIQSMRRKGAGHSGPLPKILVANRGEIAIPCLQIRP